MSRRERCRATGKRRFRDHREASRALHKAAAQRHFAELDGVECCRRELRTYDCTACKGWHLTSWESPTGLAA